MPLGPPVPRGGPETPAWPPGVGRVVLDEAGSTNAELLRRAPAGPTWLMARRQTAPRGSRGRPWTTLPGNLAASLALPVEGVPSHLAFTAGLALHDALAAVTGTPARFALKWPNDVLMRGAAEVDRGGDDPDTAARPAAPTGARTARDRAAWGKLAGILLEGDRRLMVVGFGVNLAAAPEAQPGALPPVALGRPIEPETFLAHLARAFAARDAQRQAGFEAVRRDWLARAAGLGRPVVARTLREDRTGVFEGIDDLGCLVLGTPEGPVRIPSADVFLEGA